MKFSAYFVKKEEITDPQQQFQLLRYEGEDNQGVTIGATPRDLFGITLPDTLFEHTYLLVHGKRNPETHAFVGTLSLQGGSMMTVYLWEREPGHPDVPITAFFPDGPSVKITLLELPYPVQRIRTIM